MIVPFESAVKRFHSKDHAVTALTPPDMPGDDHTIRATPLSGTQLGTPAPLRRPARRYAAPAELQQDLGTRPSCSGTARHPYPRPATHGQPSGGHHWGIDARADGPYGSRQLGSSLALPAPNDRTRRGYRARTRQDACGPAIPHKRADGKLGSRHGIEARLRLRAANDHASKERRTADEAATPRAQATARPSSGPPPSHRLTGQRVQQEIASARHHE